MREDSERALAERLQRERDLFDQQIAAAAAAAATRQAAAQAPVLSPPSPPPQVPAPVCLYCVYALTLVQQDAPEVRQRLAELERTVELMQKQRLPQENIEREQPSKGEPLQAPHVRVPMQPLVRRRVVVSTPSDPTPPTMPPAALPETGESVPSYVSVNNTSVSCPSLLAA